jgi:hypothetical protein
MGLPINGLHIAGYRALRELDIGPFGRVNLVTGKNNAGKSSLLEAIRLLFTQGSPATLQSILSAREEYAGLAAEPETRPVPEALSVPNLFTGFPELNACDTPFSISTNGSSPPLSMTARIRWYAEQTDRDGVPRLVAAQPSLFGELDGAPYLDLVGPRDTVRRLPLNRLHQPTARFTRPDTQAPPCIYLDSTPGATAQLSELWDGIALTEMERDVVEALKLVSPEIEAVSMVGGTGGLPRVAIARSGKVPRRLPLRAFGDGVNRLFGIALSLVCAKEGLLLVDEFENGLHYSILPDVWRVIFETAARLDVQVFATTHSWDCISAFQQAANDHPEVGVLVRLTAKGDTVIPTLFREDELRIAARDRIEVR